MVCPKLSQAKEVGDSKSGDIENFKQFQSLYLLEKLDICNSFEQFETMDMSRNFEFVQRKLYEIFLIETESSFDCQSKKTKTKL